VFASPLGLLALIAVPAVALLHLFRRRFRRRPVSAVFLWAAQDRVPVAGRRREPLHASPSFWCETLGALLLALALAGPRACGAGEALHFVAVLDASASMAAKTGDGRLAERAAEIVRARVRRLPRGSRVTLIQSGTRPEVLAGPAAFPEEALAKLAGYRPTHSGHARHALGSSVALALQLAGEGAVLLVTDHLEPEAWPAAIEVVSVGRPTDNFAITHATRRRARDAEARDTLEKVHLTVANYGAADGVAGVRLAQGAEVFATCDLEIPAGERRHVSFELPADTPLVEARLVPDALELDDVAWLAPVPPRTLALASRLSADLSAHLGLASPGSSSNVDRWLEIVPDSVAAPSPELAHLVLAEGAPSLAPPASPAPTAPWVLAFEARGAQRRGLIGPFLIDKQHPLLEGVTLDGVVWSASEDVALSGAPIVSAGNEPLVTEETDGARRVVRMNLDPASSTLHRSPDWPILLANLAEMRRRELPGPARTSLALGETFVYRGAGPAVYRLEGGGEVRELPSRGTLEVDDVPLPGVYTLSSEGRELCQIAFSFADPAESDLRGLRPGERAGSQSLARVLAGFTWMEVLLLTGVLGCALLDWLVLSRARSAWTAGGTESA